MSSIEPMYVISTGHLPRNARDDFSGLRQTHSVPVMPAFHREEGFIFHVDSVLQHDFPQYPALLAAARQAHLSNCPWLMFDRDADEVPGLKVYED